jgi:hypothetical protein
MTLDLEGDYDLERNPMGRWVSIIAVVIPVTAVVLLVGWFIRAFIVPPTVAISSPAMLAAATPPPPPPSIPKRAQVEATPPMMTAPTVLTSAADTPSPAQGSAIESPTANGLPMFGTLAVAPPSYSAQPAPAAEPGPAEAPVSPAALTPSMMISETDIAPVAVADTAEFEASEPITGPIPLPRPKRHVVVASSAVPLPRPKPTEAQPEPDLPQFDRHSIN